MASSIGVSPGPVALAPRKGARLRPHPAQALRLHPDGHLGRWQELNRAATLPHCVDNLETSGALNKFRRLTGAARTDFQGMLFADSDVYKTVEVVAWEAGRRPDHSWHAFIDEVTGLLAGAQVDDGYLNTYVQGGEHGDCRRHDLRWRHEMYCAGHLIQATGELAYLDLAGRLVERRGHGVLGADRFGPQYFQDHAPVREATEPTGHSVRQLYLAAGVTDLYLEGGDPTLLAAMESLWDNAFSTKVYATGAHGSRHRDEAYGDPYELPPDRAYAETCAAIASFHWCWRMLLATLSLRLLEWCRDAAVSVAGKPVDAV